MEEITIDTIHSGEGHPLPATFGYRGPDRGHCTKTSIKDTESITIPLLLLQANGFISPETGEHVGLTLTEKHYLAYLLSNSGLEMALSRNEIADALNIAPATSGMMELKFEAHHMLETMRLAPEGRRMGNYVVWVNEHFQVTLD